MTFFKYLTTIALTVASLFTFGQEIEEVQTEEANRINQTISYTLQDFNDKYYSLFKASYKSFESLKGEKAVIIDFENGEKEIILKEDGNSTFSVDFYTAMEKAVSYKLLEDITNRILITSPKGFETKTIQNTNALQNKATLILYNQEYPTKSAHQPTILIWIDKNDFTVKMKVTEPVLK